MGQLQGKRSVVGSTGASQGLPENPVRASRMFFFKNVMAGKVLLLAADQVGETYFLQ
jgi:hypothetical protein